MCDLTDGSSQWWAHLVAALDAYYQEYVNSSVVKKLQLRADDFAGPLLREPRWLRVDKRAASMVLQAVPDTIRTEVLANRLQSPLSILARILTIYRPGSAVERQQVLKALETPGSSSTAMELVEALRRWARWLKRAQDLSLQVPDPSILLRGLDQASRSLLEKHGEVNFRANMLRYSLELGLGANTGVGTKAAVSLAGGVRADRLPWKGKGRNVECSCGEGYWSWGAGSKRWWLSKGARFAQFVVYCNPEALQVLCVRGWVSTQWLQASSRLGQYPKRRNGVRDVRDVAQRGT